LIAGAAQRFFNISSEVIMVIQQYEQFGFSLFENQSICLICFAPRCFFSESREGNVNVCGVLASEVAHAHLCTRRLLVSETIRSGERGVQCSDNNSTHTGARHKHAPRQANRLSSFETLKGL